MTTIVGSKAMVKMTQSIVIKQHATLYARNALLNISKKDYKCYVLVQDTFVHNIMKIHSMCPITFFTPVEAYYHSYLVIPPVNNILTFLMIYTRKIHWNV